MSYPFLENVINAIFGTDLTTTIFPLFGIFVGLSFFTVHYLTVKRLTRNGYSDTDCKYIESTIYLCAFFGLVGAKLFHAVEYLDHSFWAQVFSRGGFSIYGGLILGLIVGLVRLYQQRLNIPALLDIIAPYLLLGYAIGRVGCQISGDGDWGVMSNLDLKPAWIPDILWAQTYIGNILGETIAAPGVYPTPIYETVLALLGFITLLSLRERFSPSSGLLFSLFLILTGLFRFSIEQIRVNLKYDIQGLSFSQAELISMTLVAIGITGVVIVYIRCIHPLGFAQSNL